MTPRLSQFLQALADDGAAYDAQQADRLLKRRNLEPATASLLSLIVRIARAHDVAEIGTSNGVSAIWLADAVSDTQGRVVSVDTEPSAEAAGNLAAAERTQPGLAGRVRFVQKDGGAYLAECSDASVDVLLLDAERTEYCGWWPHPLRVLRPGGVLAIDNVLSHPDEVAPFLALLAAEPSITGTTVAVGKGLHIAWRA